MATTKTVPTNEDVYEFIERTVENAQKRADSLALIEIMERVSGQKAYMWGPSIIGFGSYHYVYNSGHSGDAPLIGFSPRKAAISLYVFTGLDEHAHLLEGLGKFTMGKACIYAKKLADINTQVLENLMRNSIDYLKVKYNA